MGYQLSFNVVQIELPTVILLSAGGDQNMACGQRVDLVGVVNKPENLPGHDIFWEQIYGPSVTLDNPNSIGTFFVTNNRQDKRFRLWIDKGTHKEQFADAWVYYTPTSFASGVATAKTAYTVTKIEHLLNLIVDCNSISYLLTSSQASGSTPSGSPPIIEPNPNAQYSLKISWTVPTSSSVYYPYFLDTQLFYSDTDTPASPRYTDLPGSVVTHEFFPGGELELKKYYVLTRYNGTDTILSGKSCIVDYTTVVVPELIWAGAKSINNASVSVMDVSRVNFGNIYRRVESVGVGIAVNNQHNINRYSDILLGTIPESLGAGTATANTTYSVTRFDPSGIGG